MTAAYSLQGLEYRYNNIQVLNIDNFAIDAGSVQAIVGDNGTGKSTLFNLLTFVDVPSAGEIRFFEKLADDNSRSLFRRRIGYVQQNPYLFNTTVIDNIKLGLKWRGVKKQLRHNRAIDIIDQFGLESMVYRRAHELSGGEIQKIAIARAIILEPDILIMDEPFTHLDNNFISKFEKILATIKEEKSQTVIFSTHDHIRAQSLADKIWDITNGKLKKESLFNIFHGNMLIDEGNFDTGKIKIIVTEDMDFSEAIAIESNQIVLSREEIDSSMRNRFRGRIKALNESDENIQVTVEAGEKFKAIITRQAMKELDLNVGDNIWVSFKSTAVKVV